MVKFWDRGGTEPWIKFQDAKTGTLITLKKKKWVYSLSYWFSGKFSENSPGQVVGSLRQPLFSYIIFFLRFIEDSENC